MDGVNSESKPLPLLNPTFFRIMAFDHTLTGAKFVGFLQTSLGAKKGVYDADYFSDHGGSWAKHPNPKEKDTLTIDEKQDVNGQIIWDMNTGSFTQTQRFRGQTHTDEMLLTNFENLDGSQADRIDFIVYGTNGDNEIFTSDGDDTIGAGRGNDLVDAGGGSDVIIGGLGIDIIHTGDGEDTVVALTGQGFALIKDFTDGEDRIQVIEGVENASNVRIRDWGTEAGEKAHWDLLAAGFDNNESEFFRANEIQWWNAAAIFNGDDLVAVVNGVAADQLSIDFEQGTII